MADGVRADWLAMKDVPRLEISASLVTLPSPGYGLGDLQVPGLARLDYLKQPGPGEQAFARNLLRDNSRPDPLRWPQKPLKRLDYLEV